MIVSHEHKFIYYAPLKTASTSIDIALRKRFSGEPLGHAGSKYLRHDCFMPKELQDYFTFVSVRDPFSRFLSAFNFFSKPELNLEQWMESSWMIEPISTTLFFKSVKVGCVPIRIDAIIRVETLERDFNRLPFVKNPVKIIRTNVAKERRLASLTPKAIDFVRTYYCKDFEVFGYDKNIIDFNRLTML